eukprot:gene6495-24957_t
MGNAMGNKKSKEPVHIELGAQWYHGDDTITGVVRMDIQKSGGYPCDTVNLRIQGAENTCVVYTTGSGDNRQTHYARESRPIITIDVPIASIGGVLPEGHHEFPFQAKLPPGLPSSLSIGGGAASAAFARIEYGVTAADVFGAAPFNVRMTPRPVEPQPLFLPPHTEPVQCCCAPCCPCFACCCVSGMMTLGGSVSKHVLSVCEGRTAVALQSFGGVSGHTGKRPATLQSKTIPGVHDPHTGGGTASGKNKAVPKEVAALDAAQTVMKRLAEGGDGSSVLTIDASVHDSYDGHLVQVKHHYKVEGKTGSCYTDPSVGVQLYIQPPTAGAGGAGHPIASAPAAVTQQPGAFHQNTDWKPTKRESFSVPMDRAVHGGTYPPSQSGGGSGTKKKGNSIAGLLAELEGSYDDLGTIRAFCDDSDSSTALEKVTPQEFGNILK